MSKLKGLKQNQSELQKAEIAAWLHNWRKCSDEHIKVSASTPPSGAQNLPKTWLQVKLGTTITITCLNESIVLLDLVERGRKGDPEETGIPRLTAYLRRCHRASHIEKEETDDLGKQPDTDTRMSSPFGYEGKPLSGLTQLLENLPWDDVLDRGRFLPQLQEAFKQALGETRRPENEVTLWDWSLIVAALYKAALAGALLDYKSKPNDLRWRLLSVHFDGLGFLSEAPPHPRSLGSQAGFTECPRRRTELARSRVSPGHRGLPR
ncbi:MAG: hypothetical protein KatS3mg131_1995 [Candidatus Tectimicrobiota bacterium]|nr:MAG: hypothetical protein KatS3mg131_1995 [Candidatus Tectomicrobia bacterium]